jgi:aminoglycoside phosphotransferase (APT) family kinase protein
MSERLHDDEPDTSEGTVRALLEAQFPQAANLTLSYLSTSGTDNAMWRLANRRGQDMVVRLPPLRQSGEQHPHRD